MDGDFEKDREKKKRAPSGFHTFFSTNLGRRFHYFFGARFSLFLKVFCFCLSLSSFLLIYPLFSVIAIKSIDLGLGLADASDRGVMACLLACLLSVSPLRNQRGRGKIHLERISGLPMSRSVDICIQPETTFIHGHGHELDQISGGKKLNPFTSFLVWTMRSLVLEKDPSELGKVSTIVSRMSAVPVTCATNTVLALHCWIRHT